MAARSTLNRVNGWLASMRIGRRNRPVGIGRIGTLGDPLNATETADVIPNCRRAVSLPDSNHRWTIEMIVNSIANPARADMAAMMATIRPECISL